MCTQCAIEAVPYQLGLGMALAQRKISESPALECCSIVPSCTSSVGPVRSAISCAEKCLVRTHKHRFCNASPFVPDLFRSSAQSPDPTCTVQCFTCSGPCLMYRESRPHRWNSNMKELGIERNSAGVLHLQVHRPQSIWRWTCGRNNHTASSSIPTRSATAGAQHQSTSDLGGLSPWDDSAINSWRRCWSPLAQLANQRKSLTRLTVLNVAVACGHIAAERGSC